MKAKIIHVEGRRWFDKQNTYHTAKIVVYFEDFSRKDFSIPYSYGYGSMYEQHAYELLVREGIVKGGSQLSLECRENGIDYRETVIDVSRKKDLHI